MYSGIVHAHSGIRWVLLAFLVITIVLALVKWTGKKPFWEQHKKLALYTFISSHIQLLLGLILYFISPKVIFSAESMKDPIARFHLVEHLVGMIIAIALISVGYIRAKKQLPEQSSKTIFWFYFIAFVIIMATIPWPFRPYSGSWF
jgi:uncharacterized membrane protein